MPSLLDRMIDRPGKLEWRRSWPVVVSATIGFAVAQLHMYTLGVMIPPLEKSFGWTRGEISTGMLIVSVIVCPLAPFLGMLIDRLGPRRIALCGATIYCGALAALSLAQPSIWTWWLLWAFVGIGELLLAPTVWATAISSLFYASRGLALAIAMSGTGLISFAAPIITYQLVSLYSWRIAYASWGLAAACVALPLLYFAFSSDKDDVRRSRAAADPTATAPVIGGMAVRECIHTATFLKLAAVTAMTSHFTVGLLVNLVPILSSSGIPTATAALIAGAVGISQIVGRLTCGMLLDRFDARWVGAVSMVAPAISASLLLIFAGKVPAAAAAVIIFGLSVGAELDVIAYLCGGAFGLRNFGAIFGILVGLMILGSGLGPVLASLVYDFTGSYRLVLYAVLPLAFGSVAALLTLPPLPRRRDREARHALAEAAVS